MEKKKVSVQIEGRSYALITSDSEQYVQSVVDEVIERIRKVAQQSKHLDTRDCAILVAMDFCDDRRIQSTLYISCILLFGGIGLLTAFLIELKINKNK